MPGSRGPCLAYVPHLSALPNPSQGQRSIVLVLLQCDLPSVDKGFQLGLFLLSFNLLPVTDGTESVKKKSLKTKKLVPFIWIQCSSTHKGELAGGAEDLQPFSIILPLIVSKIRNHRGAVQSSCIIPTFLTHCLYCFTPHKSCTPWCNQEIAQSHTHILTYTLFPLLQNMYFARAFSLSRTLSLTHTQTHASADRQTPL